MEPIDNEILLCAERVLQESASKGTLCVSQVLSIIKELGFYSCFFYVAVPNISTDDYKLLLADVAGTAKQRSHIGESVNYRSSAIYFHPDKKSPIKQCANNCHQTDELSAHTELLDVKDKNRIHTPVFYDNELIGALSCSWSGDCDLLTEQHKQGLSLVTSLISRYWVLAKDELISRITVEMVSDLQPSRNFHDIDVFIEKIAKKLQVAIGARAVSVFKYNWYSDTLIKVAEAFSSSVTGKTLHETYRSGEKLTGTAWQDSKFRLIANFGEFISSHDFHVSSQSLDHHESILTEVRTLLYCPVGTKSKYLLRFMNREDDHRLPFLTSHRIVIAKICERMGRILDDATKDNQLANLQLVSKSAITHIEDFSQTVEYIRRALKEECVDELGVMAYDEKYNHFCHKYFSNRTLHEAISGYIEWVGDKFFSTCVEAKGISVLKVSEYHDRYTAGHLLNVLERRGTSLVTIVPFSSMRTRGFVLIPSPTGSADNASSCLERIPNHHISSLKAYAGVIGGTVESAESHLTSENARRLVGQIGHEIQGPVAELGQSAIDVIYQTLEVVSGEESTNSECFKNLLTSLRRNEYLVDQQMRQIHTLMDVAVDMAQESHGVIQVHFKPYSLFAVLTAASKEAQRDEYVDYREVRHKVSFEFNDAARNMQNIVGDVILLHRVFVNLFRNAIKYSLPRYRGTPIVIKIHGNPQAGMHIIKVINWGIPVPDNVREVIFNAFERGDSHDKLKARRGMGLGLYIARRFLAAHRGSVFCAGSIPTLDDPDRRFIEGFETTFEVRLPHGLRIGTHDDYS